VPDEGGTGQDRAENVTKRFNHAAVARARLELGLTQEQAAAAAGVDVRTYRRYESGEVNDPVHGFAIRNPSRRRILRKLAEELGLAETELLVEMVESPPVAGDSNRWTVHHAHSLPRARHFVGRGDVVRSLHAWRRAPASEGVLAIVALGGAGKTSALARFVDELEAGPADAGVFVWSFYEDRRVESFFAEALAYFSGKAEDTGHGERVDLLRATLREGPAHLLVLDGLEVLQETGAPGTTYGRIEDPTLRRLLSGVARGLGRARCLVTSRFDLTDLAAEGAGLRTVRLEPLSKDEGRSLLSEWGVSGGDAELSAWVARLGGHALSVAMVGSYVGTFLGGDIPSGLAVGLESAAQDDPIARRLLDLLETYAQALTPAERDLLARLSLFASGAELDALHGIARAGGRVAGALAELADSDLASRWLASSVSAWCPPRATVPGTPRIRSWPSTSGPSSVSSRRACIARCATRSRRVSTCILRAWRRARDWTPTRSSLPTHARRRWRRRHGRFTNTSSGASLTWDCASVR
jgi:transcriptional regulator with XRE-family HTH domain